MSVPDHSSCSYPTFGFKRRDFLKSISGAGLAHGLSNSFFSALSAADNTDDPDSPIFVLIHQAGGNDTLNTVIPIDTAGSAFYYEARPELSLSEEEALPLQDGFGLHPELSGFKELWDDGDLAVINGVGNPNPILSHFRSIDIWEAADPAASTTSGWLGRYFDHRCESEGTFDPAIGIDIRNSSSLAFRTLSNQSALTINTPDFFDYLSAEGNLPTAPGFDGQFNKTFLSNLVDRGEIGSGAHAYVTSVLKAALTGSGDIQEALSLASQDSEELPFPSTALGGSLKNVARYIRGGVPTAAYFLTQGGYDTHASQYSLDSAGRPLAGRHANLLGDLNSALSAFSGEMKRKGLWNRVVVMIYSEFSRKIVQNGNNGTDHGAAGSVFVTGGQVQQGMFGAYPSLAPEDRILNQSMPMTTDLRRVYRTILERWYGLEPTAASEILHISDTEHLPLDFLLP